MSFLDASRTEIKMLTAENGDGERRVLILFDGIPCLVSAVCQDYFCDTYLQKFADAQPIALPTDEELQQAAVAAAAAEAQEEKKVKRSRKS